MCESDRDDCAGQNSVDFDLCIIGAGTIGCYLAGIFSGKKRVLVIENNGSHINRKPSSIKSDNNEYRGETVGRDFGLGGTSKLWSGQLVPYLNLEKSGRDEKSWRGMLPIIEENTSLVRRRLGLNSQHMEYLPKGSSNAEPPWSGIVGGLSLVPIFSEWLPPTSRNFFKLFKKKIMRKRYVSIVEVDGLCKVETEKISTHKHKVVGVTFNKNGKKHSASTNSVVICCGALESTRMLMSIFIQNQKSLKSLGKNLSDHVSIKVGEIKMKKNGILSQLFTPKFRSWSMQTVRLGQPRIGNNPAHFFSFVFDYRQSCGFNLLQEGIGLIQGNSNIQNFKAALDLGSLISLSHYFFYFVFKRELFVEQGSTVAVHLDFEQLQTSSTEVKCTLNKEKTAIKDSLVKWSVAENEFRNMRSKARAFVTKWNSIFPDEKISLVDLDELSIANVYDVHHPVGTTKMGFDSRSIVDGRFEVKGFEGLFTLSTALFPSAGLSNPTFSLLCLAEEFAKQLTSSSSSRH